MAQKLPMEERLKQIISENETPSTSAVGESLTVLLVQGLHSEDKKILDKVLEKSDDDSIRATVRQLPVQSIMPLLKELRERMASKTDVRAYIKWLRYVLVCHDSYLSSDADVLEELRPHYEIFQKRAELLPKLLELQGRLNFMTAKIDEVNNTQLSKQPALAVYQDVSSESEFDPDDGKSDADENWDNLNWDDDSETKDKGERLVNGEVSSDEMEDDSEGGDDDVGGSDGDDGHTEDDDDENVMDFGE